jgi:ADP-ribose pyrophosphatase YjhB (NUDIX family)
MFMSGLAYKPGHFYFTVDTVSYRICCTSEGFIERWNFLKFILYQILRKLVGICFSILNLCLFGNLPPQGCISVIAEDDGRFLLLKRPDGTLVFPGGFIRWREHPTRAALRELSEETGLRVRLGDMVACYSIPSKRFGSMSSLVLVFCAEVIGGEMRGGVEGNPCWIEEAALWAMDEFRNGYMLNDYREYCRKLKTQDFVGAMVRELGELS